MRCVATEGVFGSQRWFGGRVARSTFKLKCRLCVMRAKASVGSRSAVHCCTSGSIKQVRALRCHCCCCCCWSPAAIEAILINVEFPHLRISQAWKHASCLGVSAVSRDANLQAVGCHSDRVLGILHSICMFAPAHQRLRVAFPLQADGGL